MPFARARANTPTRSARTAPLRGADTPLHVPFLFLISFGQQNWRGSGLTAHNVREDVLNGVSRGGGLPVCNGHGESPESSLKFQVADNFKLQRIDKHRQGHRTAIERGRNSLLNRKKFPVLREFALPPPAPHPSLRGRVGEGAFSATPASGAAGRGGGAVPGGARAEPAPGRPSSDRAPAGSSGRR